MTDKTDIVFLTLITTRSQRETMETVLSAAGGLFIETLYGRGSVNAGWLHGAFGITADETRVSLTCLISRANANAVLERLTNYFGFNKPNTGIAFTVPVNAVAV